MNKAIAPIFAAFALFVGITSASANVQVLATVSSDSIHVGDTVTLDLQLNLFPDSSKFFDPKFTGGIVEMFSGDGQHKTFFFGPGGTTEDLIWNVTYSGVGSFTPSFLGLVSYSEKFKHYEDCKWCYRDFEIEKVVKLQFLKGDFQDPDVERISVAAAAPEIDIWAMLLIGFAGVGLMSYRRAKRGVAAAALA